MIYMPGEQVRHTSVSVYTFILIFLLCCSDLILAGPSTSLSEDLHGILQTLEQKARRGSTSRTLQLPFTSVPLILTKLQLCPAI